MAFALLPWGILDNHRPEKWLLLITATSETAKRQPGDAFLLEWQPYTKRWMLGRLQPRVARQYYYDWAFRCQKGGDTAKMGAKPSAAST